MSFVSSDRTTRAAKRHRCFFCNQRIEVGEKYERRTGANSDGPWTMHMHPECRDEVQRQKWDEGDYECFEPGDFTRPMTAFDPCI